MKVFPTRKLKMREQRREVRHGGGGKATAVDLMEPEESDHHMLPVWFFVGIILLIYGILILATGILEFSRPPLTVLANLHPAIWWGALLVMIGAVYVYLFMPRGS